MVHGGDGELSPNPRAGEMPLVSVSPASGTCRREPPPADCPVTALRLRSLLESDESCCSTTTSLLLPRVGRPVTCSCSNHSRPSWPASYAAISGKTFLTGFPSFPATIRLTFGLWRRPWITSFTVTGDSPASFAMSLCFTRRRTNSALMSSGLIRISLERCELLRAHFRQLSAGSQGPVFKRRNPLPCNEMPPTTPSKAQIGLWLEAARKRHGEYSREQIAPIAGTTARTVYDWEKGITAPPADKLFEMLTRYGVEVIDLAAIARIVVPVVTEGKAVPLRQVAKGVVDAPAKSAHQKKRRLGS